MIRFLFWQIALSLLRVAELRHTHIHRTHANRIEIKTSDKLHSWAALQIGQGGKPNNY